MAKGRKPGPPTQRPNGYWYAHHPGLKRPVRLAATTFAEALAEQQSFYGVVEQPTEEYSPVPGNPVSQSGGMGDGAGTMLDLDGPEVANGPAKKADSAADLLSGWAKSTAPMAPSAGVAANPTTPLFSPPISSGSHQNGPGVTPMVSRTVKPQKGLTPEQSAKIASGLKKMVVNTNVVVVAAAIQMFGVVPAPLDPEEITLLQMGWEMWLDELFLKAKLKPVHLVIVGNLMIAVSMWAAGEKKKKLDPKVDPTASKSAPGHQASVTPIVPPKG